MKITIICAGKLKERFYADAAAEYLKRLSRFADVAVAEVKDEPAPERLSAAEAARVLEVEGERLLALLPERAYAVALAVDGRAYTSEGFSAHLNELMTGGAGHIAFVIGGSLGLSAGVLRRCRERVSFSGMTFPHQLVRVMLLEQVYRAFKIMNGEVYHK